jgi:hypothetical protein
LFQKVETRPLACSGIFLPGFAAKKRVADAMLYVSKGRFFWEYVHTVRFLMARAVSNRLIDSNKR